MKFQTLNYYGIVGDMLKYEIGLHKKQKYCKNITKF